MNKLFYNNEPVESIKKQLENANKSNALKTNFLSSTRNGAMNSYSTVNNILFENRK